MSLDDHGLLSRLADTVRAQIAPAVDDEYARTQAFMASVILHRLAKQARLSDEHRTAEVADVAALADQLDAVLAGADTPADVPRGAVAQVPEGVPADADAQVAGEVRDAVARMRSHASIAAVSEVIDALYRWDPSHRVVGAALAEIRRVLRRDIDRRLEIAQ
ncbi:hypothetical protein [Candidatus Poriferisodalis sp.]|uniref:hypothetical protein n=1 Tax=Candidatus Poriferisodalis sp. TaxID=3101277 RepID=UPI003B02205C